MPGPVGRPICAKMAKAKKKEEHIPGATARRLAAHQVEYLENTFKDTPNPPESKRKEIGKLLEMDERKVMIWFQNKRQRVKQKQREHDNSHLKNTNAQLTNELESEKRREFQLEQENQRLKDLLNDKKAKMQELRSSASNLLIEYYANRSRLGDQAAAATLEEVKPALAGGEPAGDEAAAAAATQASQPPAVAGDAGVKLEAQ